MWSDRCVLAPETVLLCFCRLPAANLSGVFACGLYFLWSSRRQARLGSIICLPATLTLDVSSFSCFGIARLLSMTDTLDVMVQPTAPMVVCLKRGHRMPLILV